MTITETENRIAYVGNGVTAAFPFPYPFAAATDLVVVETVIATGLETVKTLTTHYTISGVQDDLDRYPNGGTINAVLFPSSVPASTVTWTIYRDPPETQGADLVENDNLPAETVEATFDYVTMLIQRLSEVTRRSLRQPEGDSASIAAIPNKLLRANKYLAFDSSGDPEAVDAASASGTSVTATGTTTDRLLADWFADFVNVKSWGAVGDGVVNDTAAVTTAVADAYNTDRELYWPAGGGAFGTYLLTASIPNFHDVRHVGPGVVHHTGGTDFYVDPSLNPGRTNVLYVSTAGLDTNDGLSSSQPMLTVQHAGDQIYKYSYGDVIWKIVLAAGTYGPSTSFNKPFPSPNSVYFLGVVKATGVQPTTIIQSTGVGQDGIYFQNFIRARVEDINFKSFRDAASPSSNSLGSGLIADSRCEVYTRNVWTDDCDQGVYITNGSHLRMVGGRHGFNAVNGNGVQLIRHSHGTVGYGSSAADITGATGTAFIGGQRGVMLQEYSMAHTDNCYFSAQTISGLLVTVSRVHSVTSTYDTCVVGIDGRLGANLGDTDNTFTNCGVDVRSSSRTTRATGTDEVNDSLLVSEPLRDINAVGATTQSASPVTAYTYDFLAKELQNRGHGFKLELRCAAVGTANTKTVVVTFGATTLLTAVIAATVLSYAIDVELKQVTSASAQKVYTEIRQNGELLASAYTAIAENCDNAKTLTVTHQVANTGDLNRIGWADLKITH